MNNLLENKINDQAKSFVTLNQQEYKHLDYSVDSLNYVEKFIEEKADSLVHSSSCIEHLASFMIKIFSKNFKGEILTQNENHIIFHNLNSGEKFNAYNYVYQRVLEKQNNRFAISL